MKNILVPFDYSGVSKEAFKMVIDIASRAGGSVTVQYVIFLPTISTPDYVGISRRSPVSTSPIWKKRQGRVSC